MLKRQNQQSRKENQSDGVKEPGEYSLLLPGFLSYTLLHLSTCSFYPLPPREESWKEIQQQRDNFCITDFFLSLLQYRKPRANLWKGEGNGNLLQYSCLENPMDRGAWWATFHGVTKSWTWVSTQPLEITGHMFISKCVMFWKPQTSGNLSRSNVHWQQPQGHPWEPVLLFPPSMLPRRTEHAEKQKLLKQKIRKYFPEDQLWGTWSHWDFIVVNKYFFSFASLFFSFLCKDCYCLVAKLCPTLLQPHGP